MFTTIAVALDLEPDGDRALPVVRALSELGDVVIELLTVDSPGMPLEFDAFELGRRATANGWPEHSYTILRNDDAAAAIVEHLRDRDDVLLVMATTAKRPLVGHLLGSVTERILRTIEQPVLLVGPHVAPTFGRSAPTPIWCVDPSDLDTSNAVPAVVSWLRTFRGATPWVAEVLPPVEGRARPTDVVESAHVRHLVDELAGYGIRMEWEVLHDGNAEHCLEQFASRFVEPLLVTTSSRWTDGRAHWHSVTRQFVQHADAPVLVVPARRAPTNVEPRVSARRVAP